uniref:Cytochrome c oxidase subunit 2 n=1 Tax=Haploginglymus sp. JP-2016 TaxID=1867951 RepID=A0A330IVC0_9CRUS|nr:COX2 [Haploginglymus sp. JP-2016]
MPTWSMIAFQDSASPLMEQLIFFHDFTMMIIILILTLVFLNITFITSYKITNRNLLQEQKVESIWTILPVLILFSITLPSLQILYLLDDPFAPVLTIKAIGHQWYWSYEYSDFKEISFNSYMSPSNMEHPRLMDTDSSVIMPTNTDVRMVVTASDVIHSWAMPTLGLKVDAVPGRLNQTMLTINRPGIFYGQCSEICGANHSFMPIKIEALPMTFFIKWISSLS